MEMHQISLALETYKNKFGEYPPDLYDKAAVVRHVKKRWPRFNLAGADNNAKYWALLNAVKNVYRNSDMVNLLHNYDNTIGASSFFMNNDAGTLTNPTVTQGVQYVGALPFWLGGFPNSDGKLAGFSADPEAPFGTGLGTVSGETTPTIKINNGNTSITWTGRIGLGTHDKDSVFYEMIIGKNVEYVTTADGIVFPVLVNRDATVNKDGTTPVPYVYFKSNSSNGGKMAYTHYATNIYLSKGYKFNKVFDTAYAALGQITAYARSGNVDGDNQPLIWQEAERFQLIHPGLDGVFGIIRTPKEDAKEIALTDSTTLNISGFRSIDMNITTNDIGQHDFDNITNFSDYQQIKSILP
jgi:hypothetical protein